MKKIVSTLMIFLITILLNTSVYATVFYSSGEDKTSWNETGFSYSSTGRTEDRSGNKYRWPPQIGTYGDLLLCTKSGARLNTGSGFKKFASGTLEKEVTTSYIVSETRRTGRYRIIDGATKFYSDSSSTDAYENMDGVYLAQEQQYAFWKNSSEAKRAVNGGEYNSCSPNSQIVNYASGGKTLLTETITVADYLEKSARKINV